MHQFYSLVIGIGLFLSVTVIGYSIFIIHKQEIQNLDQGMSRGGPLQSIKSEVRANEQVRDYAALKLHNAKLALDKKLSSERKMSCSVVKDVSGLISGARAAVRGGSWRQKSASFYSGVLNDAFCDCIAGTLQALDLSDASITEADVGPSRMTLANTAVSSTGMHLRGQRKSLGDTDLSFKAVGAKLELHTDEPRSGACSYYLAGSRTFACPNKAIFASRVGDGVCDCCDGSDEIGSPFGIVCPSTCNKSAKGADTPKPKPKYATRGRQSKRSSGFS
eukprot:GSChrysophyteH1.ASY1.ANO1.467.1 assembled CDS